MNNILIVEDEDFLIRVLEDNLAAEGYAVDVAKNGEQAVGKMRKCKPNLILLDILMPKCDGFYVLSEIKKDPKRKSIPVIVLSNLGEEAAINRAMKMGADDYFIKSQHKIEEVIKRIGNYFKGKKMPKR